MKQIAILGSTGSIGTQTLDVVDQGGFTVVALTAYANVDLLVEQAMKYSPRLVVIMNPALADELEYKLQGQSIQVMAGMDGLIAAATHPDVDMVVNSLVGAVGVRPTWEAIRAGKDIALANKETLVTAGALIVGEAQARGVQILPIDSEHNALFQALHGEDRSKVSRLILTASGGPFRTFTKEQLVDVTPAQALKHPNWAMGGKITIDSATLMNKGLEVIEARWLFGIDYDQIDVVVHPQSIVHSLVEFVDSSILAELGLPDMRVPIQYALHYPVRQKNTLERLDLVKVGQLSFEAPKWEHFPCLCLAIQAGRRGGTLPAVMNAANEVAVYQFLHGEIGFMGIPDLIAQVMEHHEVIDSPDLDTILAADAWARTEAERVVKRC